MVLSFYTLSRWAIRLLIFVSLGAWGGYLQAQTSGVVTTQRFTYTGQIVTWAVPTGITSLTVEARGAEGGNAPSSTLPAGKGAVISGTVAVTPGQLLSILVGGQPAQVNNGGGGSFVVTADNAPLIIAGGGGGSGFNNDSEQKHGQAATSGGAGAGGGGVGGVDGQGGKSIPFNAVRYGAGGGLRTDGEGDGNRGGKAFVNGGAGGFNGLGGFGGGGLGTGTSNGGGGGGYSGGGVGGATGVFGVGGGGGSFTAGTRSVTLSGATDGNSGNGLVTITYTLPTIRYVKQGGSGTGDGTSWTDASGDLQSQIIAPGVEQVWVAAGTYKPTTGTNRNSSFFMKEAVGIYGGFAGNETTLSQRPTIDPVAGQPSSTTLSGDIGAPGDNSDNTYHVISNNSNYGVNLTSRAVLDGFVITGGGGAQGGGIFNVGSSPTITNCSLVGNGGSQGGGMYNRSCSPTLTNLWFGANVAISEGGALFNSSSNPVVTSCSFQNNRAGSFGGAIYNVGSRPSLTNCSLQANVAALGGAIAVLGNSQATLTNCAWQSNTATTSGGVFFSDNSDLLLTNCSFQSNLSSVGSGNVLVAQNGGRRVFTNCVVYGNGVGTTFGAPVTATYCLFENTVTNYSGSHNRTTRVSPFVSASSVALNACAPAINTGSNEAYSAAGGGMPPSPPTDLAGNPRIVGDVIDMGAVEFQGTPNTQTAFTQLPASATGCVGSRLSIPFSVSGTGPFSVQLYREGLAVGPAQSSTVLSFSSLQPADAGSYSVVVTGACNSVTSTAFNLTITSQSPDYQPLVDLYNSTDGPNWPRKGNWLTGCTPCGWEGVNCDGDGRVTGLILPNNQLSGPLPASLSMLTQLQVFQVDFNRITGTIPAGYGSLTNLQYLNLSQNQFSGPIPASLGNLTNLQQLYLNNNQLSGCFPASLSVLCGRSVDLRSNPGLPDGGDLEGFCSRGAGSDAFAPLATANPNPVCAGSPVSLSVSVGTSYQWSGPAGFAASTQTPGFNSASAANSGVYSVTVGNGSATCTATASVSLTVNALPMVSITPSATAVCAGQSALLAATPDLASYRWSTPNDGPLLTTASISVSVAGTYSLTVTNASGCTATAQASLRVNPLPTPAIQGLPGSICQEAASVPLTGNPAGGSFSIDGAVATSFNPAKLSVGQHTVVYSYTNASGCSNTASQTVTIKATPAAPTITTRSGQPYPAGVSSLTISQNTGNVTLMVSGCAGGTLTWAGGSATTLSVSTASTGVQTFTATCTSNGCTSPAGTATVTVVAPTLKVLSRDPDNGQLGNNTLKPYLLLQNASTTPINYSTITLRYWLTTENTIPLLFQKNYVAIGQNNLNLRYVALDQPRPGATGYIEYSFSGAAGSLAPMGDSGPLEIQVNKQNYSAFDQRDDYSYVNNNSAYFLNPRITAYQNGVLFYGVEPTGVGSARLGVTEPGVNLQVRVLGNPVKGTDIELEVSGAEGQPLRLQVMDQQGRSVSERLVETAGVVERQTLTIGEQPAGLLLLRVSTPTQSQTVKVLKTE